MHAFEIREQTTDYSGIVRTERPTPDLGPNDVLVDVRAASINYRDIAIARPDIPYPRVSYPVVPLSDGAGEVVRVGSQVEQVAVGDRVTTPLAPDWRDGTGTPEKLSRLRGSTIEGMLQEYISIPEHELIHVPEHLSYAEAAAIPCAGLTAWRALIEDGGLHAGRTVLLLGSGGVSTFGLQFAEMHGARTIVTSSSDEKLERLASLGAWETINYETTPRWGEHARELTDGRGVDQVVEVGGPGTLEQSLEAITPNGHIHLIGVLSGHEGQIDPSHILHNIVTVEGIMGAGSHAMFERMARAIEVTGMTPVVDRTFSFDATHDAFTYAASGDQLGKAVIEIE